MIWLNQKSPKDEKVVAKKEPIKVKVAPPVAVVADWSEPSRAPAGPLCECGEPVAEGQTFVCAAHIRSH